MWERLVKSAFFELILAFYPRDLLWGLLYRRDAPEVRSTLYSWITYISDPHKLWKFERNRWDGMCHACLVFSWTDLWKLFLRIHFIFFSQSTMICKRYSAPTFFMLFESNSLRKIQENFIFNNHGLCHPCYSLTIWLKISRAFCFFASCRSDRVLSMLLLL